MVSSPNFAMSVTVQQQCTGGQLHEAVHMHVAALQCCVVRTAGEAELGTCRYLPAELPEVTLIAGQVTRKPLIIANAYGDAAWGGSFTPAPGALLTSCLQDL